MTSKSLELFWIAGSAATNARIRRSGGSEGYAVTELGRFAVECYARYPGISTAEFIKGMSSRQTPEDVAKATAGLANNGSVYRCSVSPFPEKGLLPHSES